MMPRYLTDGVHLYEIECITPNFGRVGGWFLTVRNVMTGQIRELSQLEQAICEPV